MWKSLKKKTRRIIRNRRGKYNEEKKAKILNGSVNKFHECVKAFINDDKKRNWSPRELYPKDTELQVAEKMAEFFNNISIEYTPLDCTKIPVTFDVYLHCLAPKILKVRLKTARKPNRE